MLKFPATYFYGDFCRLSGCFCLEELRFASVSILGNTLAKGEPTKSTGMSTVSESITTIAAFCGAGGIGLMLLAEIVLLTIAFPKIRRIEELICSDAEHSALRLRKVWGGGPYGRLMRSSYVWRYLMMRKIPFGHFKRSAADFGDPEIDIPLNLRLWALVPSNTMFLSFVIFLIAGQFTPE